MAAKNIFIIPKEGCGFNNIHQLVKGAFSEAERHPSAVSDSHYFVLSSLPPVGTVVEHSLAVKTPADDARAVMLESVVAFDKNLRCINTAQDRVEYARSHQMTPEQALAHFADKAGLAPMLDEVDIEFAGRVRSPKNAQGKDFVIMNVFRIAGLFSIVDRTLFLTALQEGVGGRASYGYGLVKVRTYI